MKQTWRWFGPDDPVTVSHMLQCGVEGVVTSLYDLPAGEIWERKRIASRKTELAFMPDGTSSGLAWDVVESLPISESIKTRTGAFKKHIHAYCKSLENLAAEGIKLVCYNFMPVLDWTRTNTSMQLKNGATCMSFDLVDFAMFDIHILKRTAATLDYAPDIVNAAKKRFDISTPEVCKRLTKTIVAGLPGSSGSLNLEELRVSLAKYKNIDRDKLRQNLKAFLEAVIPTAERLDIKLCCHPDDPPWPVLGLPRIVSTEEDLAWLIGSVKSNANGITFCSGSLGARSDNDLCSIVDRLAEHIYFVHLRNVRRQSDSTPTDFFEDTHLGGSTDMISLLRSFIGMHPNLEALPMRPDHGQAILSDIEQYSIPGYPLCGRMRGLAELRGALLALEAVQPRKRH